MPAGAARGEQNQGYVVHGVQIADAAAFVIRA
jgi:hypothetical protein